MKVIRKDDLIAMLQALPGNPVMVVNNDGGEYWGYYFTSPELVVKTAHPEYNHISIGHPKPSAGEIAPDVNLDETRTYVIIK